MVKNFHFILTALVMTASLAACSKQSNDRSFAPLTPGVEAFPIENTKLKDCHFKDANPTYSFGSTITPNPIICSEGVAKKVELLSPNPLPNGLQFDSSQLALSGIANEKVVNMPYSFYLENEAGYVILKLQTTIR